MLKISARRMTPASLKGKNFVHEHAEQRLAECAAMMNEQQKNAIFVNGTPIRYLIKLLRGVPCSCSKKQTSELPLTNVNQNIDVSFDFSHGTIGDVQNTYSDDLFEDSMQVLQQPQTKDTNGFDPEKFMESLDDNGVNCAVCYRTRIVGGYEEVNASRQVFDVSAVVDSEGYTIDHGHSPSKLVCLETGFVTFECFVPKYFDRVEYQVYDNDVLLPNDLWFGSNVLTLADVRARAGSSIQISVRDTTITHIMIRFVLPSEQLKADFPQDGRELDFEKFDALTSISAVIANTVTRLNVHDVVIRNRSIGGAQVWKIRDYTYYRLQNGYQMGWTANLINAQKDEAVYDIWKAKALR